MSKTKLKKLKGLGSINPTTSEEKYTEAEIEKMTEEAEAYKLELLSLEESKYKLDDSTQVSLGHPDYVPTDSEVKRIVKDGCQGATLLKKSLFYTWQYKIYKREPYNCETIAEFVGKYFGLSKATFYRQLNQVLINHQIHGEFGGENYICDFHCQKLNRYSKMIESKGESLKSFWEFLSCSEPDGITSELIEKYAILLGYCESLMTISEAKKLGLPLHKFVDSNIPEALKKFESQLNGEKTVSSNQVEETQETSSESCSDLEADFQQDSQSNSHLVVEENDDKNQKAEEKNTRPENKDIESAREIDMAIVSCQGKLTPSLEKVVNLIFKLTKGKGLSKNDLMELQNIIEALLNSESAE